jgi:hypothetical protein
MAELSIGLDLQYLFNLVNQRTLYIADQVDPSLNEMMIGKIPITNDEYDAFIVLARRGSVEVFKALSRLSFDLTQPFSFLRDAEGKDVAIQYNFKTKDEQQAAIMEPILADHMQRAIVAFIVKEWLRTKQINTSYYQTDAEEYDYCMKELRSLKGYSNRAKTSYNYF